MCLKRLLEQRAARPVEVHERAPLLSRVGRRLLGKEETEQVRRERTQVRVWGRRVWGRWASDGTRQVEVEEFDWQAFGE